MADYHLSVKIVSRSKGQSSLAASAYRSGITLFDQRTGIHHNYTRKSDVVYSNVFLPPLAPNWASVRQELWSRIEEATKRRDGQLAREVELGLPRELSLADQCRLVSRFAAALTDRGMVVDAAIHGSRKNPHAHLLLPMRRITVDGIGQVERSWNDRQLVEQLRVTWQEHANDALREAGSAATIDHRSLAARGIARQPTTHLGARLCNMARRGLSWAVAEVAKRIGDVNDFANLRSRFLQSTIKQLTWPQADFTVTDVGRQAPCSLAAADLAGVINPVIVAGRHR